MNKTWRQNFLEVIHQVFALTLRNQGSQKIPAGYHQIDLRGSLIGLRSHNNPFEASIGDFVRNVMNNSKMYFQDKDGNPIAYPGLYVRYISDGQYMDLRVDTGAGSTSMQSKVEPAMNALGHSPLFNCPLVGSNQVDPDGGLYYRFSIVQPKPTQLDINDMEDISYNELILGSTLSVNYNSEPHMLISGGTGSGKTYALELLIAEMKQKISNFNFHQGGALYIGDPKYSDLAQYANIIGVTKVAQSPAQIAGMLREATDAMNKRYQTMPRGREALGKTALNLGYAPIFIVIDEFSSLLASLKNTKNGKKIADEINGYLTEIIQKGRQANCYLVLAMQRASVDSGLSSDIRYNFSTKIILGNSDATTISMLFGSQKDNQLARIEHIGGGYYIKNDGLQPQKFYVFTYNRNKLLDLMTGGKNMPMSLTNFRKNIIKTGEIVDKLMVKANEPYQKQLEKNLIFLLQHSPAKYKNQCTNALKLCKLNDINGVHRILDNIGNELVYEF